MKGLHNVVLAKDVQGNAFWVPIKQEGGLPVVHVSHNTGMALAGEAAPAAKVKMKLDPSIKPDKVKQLSHDDKMLVLLALHQRLAHSTGRRLYLTLKERGWGDVYTQKECAEVNCDVCRLLNRKACKIPRVPEQARAAWKPGEKAYQDLTDMPWGVGGFKKLSVIVDGVSRRVSCMALRHKDQAIIHAVAYIEQVRQEGMKVRVWRSDNGGEFISDAYTIMLAENSIAQKTGAPYTPESQGIVERANGTIKRLFGKVLRSLGTPASLWPGLVQGVVQAINNAVHASTGESPYKKAGLLAKQELPVLALGDTIQAMDPQDNLAKEGYYGGSISPQVASCIVRSTNGGWRILRVHPSSVKLLDWGRGIEPQVPGEWTAAPPEKQLLPDNVEYDSIDGDQYEDGVGQGAGKEEPADNLDIDDNPDAPDNGAKELGKGSGVVAMHENKQIVGKVMKATKNRLDIARFEYQDGQWKPRELSWVPRNTVVKSFALEGGERIPADIQPMFQGELGQAGQAPAGQPQDDHDVRVVVDTDSEQSDKEQALRAEVLKALAAKGIYPGLPENKSKNQISATPEDIKGGSHREADLAELKKFHANKVLGPRMRNLTKEILSKTFSAGWRRTFKGEGDNRKAKSRLFVRGFEDKRDRGWVETFSGTADQGHMRTAILYSLNRKFKAAKGDVEVAFLQTDAPDKMYLRMPDDLPPEAAELGYEPGLRHMKSRRSSKRSSRRG